MASDIPDKLPIFEAVSVDTKSDPPTTTIRNTETGETTKVTLVGRLGKSGKEGTTYKAKLGEKNDKKRTVVALKAFKNNKKARPTETEATFQMHVANAGIAPRVYGYIPPETGQDRWQIQTMNFKQTGDKPVSKGPKIMMQMMGQTLQQYIQDQPGNKLSDKSQYKLIAISLRLDEIGIYHNDPNPLNYMVTDEEFYFIDFGMTKWIKDLKSKTGETTYHPNVKALGTMLHSGMQGLVTRKILKGGYKIIEEYVDMARSMSLTDEAIQKAFDGAR